MIKAHVHIHKGAQGHCEVGENSNEGTLFSRAFPGLSQEPLSPCVRCEMYQEESVGAALQSTFGSEESHALEVRDTSRNRGEEHFGIAQDLLCGMLTEGRKGGGKGGK